MATHAHQALLRNRRPGFLKRGDFAPLPAFRLFTGNTANQVLKAQRVACLWSASLTRSWLSTLVSKRRLSDQSKL